jgi:hypothetical protein
VRSLPGPGRTLRAIGFDDAPFARGRRGAAVRVAGVVCAGTRFEGLVLGSLRQDGWNATAVLRDLLAGGKFLPQLHLVLLAGLGGYGDLCVLDMGEPIRIAEIAANLITMAGRIPGAEIPIVYTGLRPGEKLSEEVLTEDEEETAQVRNGIRLARSRPPPADLPKWLREIQELAEKGDREGLFVALRHIVPTYRRTPGQPLEPATAAQPAPSVGHPEEPRQEGAFQLPVLSWFHSLTVR